MMVKKKRKTRVNKRAIKRRPISVYRLKKLAFQTETLIEAKATVELDLAALIDKDPKLSAAWERGQFLRRLHAVARRAFAPSQAAGQLGISQDEFAELLKTDREAKQIWTEGRLQLSVSFKDKLMDAVSDGKLHAISRLENLLRSEAAAESQNAVGDFEHVSQQILAKMIGISRNSLHQWHKEKGLERNSDGTYNLFVAIPWLIRWTEAKAVTGKGPAQVDLQRHERGLIYRMERLEKEGFLQDTREVVKGLLAREQAALDASRHHVDELARSMEGLDFTARRQRLLDHFDFQRKARMKLPAGLNLPNGSKELLTQLLSSLEPHEKENDDE